MRQRRGIKGEGKMVNRGETSCMSWLCKKKPVFWSGAWCAWIQQWRASTGKRLGPRSWKASGYMRKSSSGNAPSSISATRELVRTANSPPPPQASWLRCSGGRVQQHCFHKPCWRCWYMPESENCSKMAGLLLWSKPLLLAHVDYGTSWGTRYFEVHLPR